MRSVGHAALLCTSLLAGCSALSSAPVAQRPTRPNAVPSDYRQTENAPSQAPSGHKALRVQWVPAASFASRLGLSFSWVEPNRKFRLKGVRGVYDFEMDSRECELAGQRVFMGEAARMVKGQASFSLIDADKLLAPIMQPGSGASSVPGLKTIVLDPGHGGNDAG
ncbi:MAG: hypothetical protein WC378_10535, partial [Opitutaceae bacterium]